MRLKKKNSLFVSFTYKQFGTRHFGNTEVAWPAPPKLHMADLRSIEDMLKEYLEVVDLTILNYQFF